MSETPSVLAPLASPGPPAWRLWKRTGPLVPAGLDVWVGRHARFLAAVALLTLLAALPLFQFKEMAGHDSLAYLPRFVEFWENLKHGIMVPRWAPDLGAGYGEPTFNFNPPLLYYVGSLFHALGFTFIASENLAIFALLLTGSIGMYLFGAELWGRRGGLVASTAFTYSTITLTAMYVNHSLADFTALASLPFAFWGVYGATSKRSVAFRAMGAAGIAGLMLSSISVAIIAMPPLAFCCLWIAFHERNAGALARGASCFAIGLALSAFFWLPALRETGFVHIDRREERLNYRDHFLYIQQLFYSKWGYGLSVRGTGDGQSFSFGPVHLVLLAIAALLMRPLWRASRLGGALLAALLISMLASVFLMTNALVFVWDHVGALHPIQFPWRFLYFASFAVAFACGAPFLLMRGKEEMRGLANALMVVAVAAIVLVSFRHADPQSFRTLTDADYSAANIASKGLPATAREFEPIGVRQFPAQPAGDPLSVLSGTASFTVTSRTPVERRFIVAAGTQAQLRMNTFYFPGWTLYVDGHERTTDHRNANGLMDFSLPQGTHDVRFAFRDTPLRTWSTRLSLAALAVFFLAPAAEIWWRRRRTRRHMAAPEGGSPSEGR